jgi:hypothetical protein
MQRNWNWWHITDGGPVLRSVIHEAGASGIDVLIIGRRETSPGEAPGGVPGGMTEARCPACTEPQVFDAAWLGLVYAVVGRIWTHA